MTSIPPDHAEREKARKHASYMANREQALANAKNWAAEHVERRRENQRLYYIRTREYQRAQQRAYRESHKEEIKAAQLRYAQNNRPKVRMNRANRYAQERGATGTVTLIEWQELKARFNFCCACCGRHESEAKLERDHIIPVTKGGSNTIDNIQPLCRTCNAAKGTDTTDYRPWHQLGSLEAAHLEGA